jgi:hypothetical protein
VYENIGHKYKLEWPSTILGCVSIVVTIPIYIFYWNGPYIREKSKFAQTLAADRKKRSVVEVTCGSGQEGPELVYDA